MRLFAIFILLPQILSAQSMIQFQGFETNNYNEPVNGYTSRWVSIYDGTNIYNAREVIQLINPSLPLSTNNCVVENQYVWGHYDSNKVLYEDVVIQFHVNPDIGPSQYITYYGVPPWPAGSFPFKPRTRIANSVVVTGSSVDRQYCRTTWRLSNPTAQMQYFQLQYNVGAPVATGNCFDSFVVGPHMTNDVVCRYMDLVWIDDYRQYVATKYPDSIAEGPYGTFNTAVPPYQVKYTGVTGSYIQPPAPTRKAILDYLSTGFFNTR